MYVAVKGGERAIEASRALLAQARRGDPALAELAVAQLAQQLKCLVDRVMAEASLFDPELAALAIKQAMGDPIEAAFLLRAYRTTLPRLGFTEPVDTQGMRQVLGPSFDYTQRLLDFSLLSTELAAPDRASPSLELPQQAAPLPPAPLPSALLALEQQGLVEPGVPSDGDPVPPDITREPVRFPMPRAARLQSLARADEGWVLGMGYATQRGYGYSHPFAGDIRFGAVAVELVPDELDFAIVVGEIEITECQMINQFAGNAQRPPQFTRGHGMVFGHGERKAMAMALVDRALRAEELGEIPTSPAQDAEFALPHGDGVEASGFVQHLKLPHHVTFESELQLVRALRADLQTRAAIEWAVPVDGLQGRALDAEATP